jgi:hypothetical protein
MSRHTTQVASTYRYMDGQARYMDAYGSKYILHKDICDP